MAAGRIFAAKGDCVIGAEAARALGLTVGQRFIGQHGMGGDNDDGESGSEAKHAAHPLIATVILKPTASSHPNIRALSIPTPRSASRRLVSIAGTAACILVRRLIISGRRTAAAALR
jgi:hypothetical protein